MSKEIDGTKVSNKKSWQQRRQDFTERFKNYGAELRNKWINDKKRILINYSIFVSIFVIVLLIDQLTKTFLFSWDTEAEWKGDGKTIYHGLIFGVRSVEHFGVTLLPWKGKTVVIIIQILSVLIFLAIITIPFLTNSIWMIILFSFIAAGNVGNMLDRFMFSGRVKDILFASFLETIQGRQLGTFNVADIALVGGSAGLVVYFLIQIIIEYVEEQKEAQKTQNSTENIELNTDEHVNEEQQNQA
ncbi:lipoprotein signal peptidase [Mycoplasmopsis californica]|uniref:Lipoprotein signal peptidase n=1 Tax=Mycoplasmopsis californica TaxID=2113 RepID=A0A059XRH3_9BACT|nr:signal peptidase II [Mycoplasmopsis californica]AIA29388.1 lipoprotein signal peptidase [Mycoplasmopsis californica]